MLKLLRSPGIDSKESIPPAYVACRARFLRFLAPHRLCLKIPALVVKLAIVENPRSQNCIIKIRFLEVHSKKHLVDNNVTLKCSQFNLKGKIIVF
jgi:hypothetical protein